MQFDLEKLAEVLAEKETFEKLVAHVEAVESCCSI